MNSSESINIQQLSPEQIAALKQLSPEQIAALCGRSRTQFNEFKAACIRAEMRLSPTSSQGYWWAKDKSFCLEAEAAKCNIDIVLLDGAMHIYTNKCYTTAGTINAIPLTIEEFAAKCPDAWHFFGRGLLIRPSSLDNLYIVDSQKMDLVNHLLRYRTELQGKVIYAAKSS